MALHSKQKKNRIWMFALVVIATALWAPSAFASHFRYGTISWRIPDPVGAPRTVEFTVQQAWRSSGAPPTLDCTELSFGDGQTSAACGGVQNVGTGVDAAGQGYTLREYVTTHAYAGAQSTFLAFFSNCCRVSGLQNGSGGNYRVETVVSFGGGNTGGPVSASPALRQLQVGNVRTLFFPAFDPDGDAVACRLATDAEAGISPATPSVPAGGAQPTIAAAPGGCLVTWNVTQAVANQRYVLHVVLESTHAALLSSSQVDLIIEMVNPPPPVCAGTGSFVVDPGTPFTTQTTGTDPGMVAGNLTLGAQNAPLGSIFAPPVGSASPSPFTSSFTWTPGLAAAGSTTIVVVNYTNSLNLTGTCFLTIHVPPCANYGAACTVGLGACQASGTNVCAAPGVTTCNATPGAPSPETCDGVDNDCDGAADDTPVDAGLACSTGLPGVCAAGSTACQSGSIVCDGTIDPGAQVESCDAVDNDCDGQTDEGFGLGGACTSGVGACEATGVIVCSGGAASCNAVPGVPALESCNGLDDDCDGTPDDGNPGGGVPCDSGLQGQCAAGATACQGAQVVCAALLAPSAELCDDALDTDCDGLPSNGCLGDADGDGLSDRDEKAIGTDPNDADSDDDGVIDGKEPEVGEDEDEDGLVNGLDPDSDNDGLYDGTELGFDCAAPATDTTLGHCIPDADGGLTVTDPLDADSDDGGVSDGEEDLDLDGVIDAGETDPTAGHGADDLLEDSDGDGLTDTFESALGTNPNDADSDDDGVKDGSEANLADDTDGDGAINALDFDSDADGLFDGTEVGNGCDDPATDVTAMHCQPDGDQGATKTSPVDADSDDGGVNDGDEDDDHDGGIDPGETDPTKGHGADDFDDDADKDGLKNGEEIALGTDPNDADSDDDGVKDGAEPTPGADTDGDGLIDALDADSDDDGLFDGTELGLGCSDPATDASKGSCIPDADQGATKTDPLDADTDDGSVSDGDEDKDHDGAIDPGETDPTKGHGSDDVPVVGCVLDAECGGARSGRVCALETHTCVEGCRGTTPDVCAEDQLCTSTNAAIGECVADDIFVEGNGFICAVGGRGEHFDGLYVAALLLLAAGARRRLRRANERG